MDPNDEDAEPPNSNIPTFKIENEDNGGTSERRHTGHPENEKTEDNVSSGHHLDPSEDNRMQRSSSLKIGKPPAANGTSREKKIVRFADALGLDLVDVKVFANDGSIPQIPYRAFSDLQINLPSSPQSEYAQDKYVLVALFEQPGSDAHFVRKVQNQKVCLENVIISDLKLSGIVRTANIDPVKKITVRYTTNNWRSSLEQQAEYVEGSSDTVTDKFTFTIHPRRMKPGDKLIFALKYEVLQQEFWDNNNDKNYALLCKEKYKHCTRLNSRGRNST